MYSRVRNLHGTKRIALYYIYACTKDISIITSLGPLQRTFQNKLVVERTSSNHLASCPSWWIERPGWEATKCPPGPAMQRGAAGEMWPWFRRILLIALPSSRRSSCLVWARAPWGGAHWGSVRLSNPHRNLGPRRRSVLCSTTVRNNILWESMKNNQEFMYIYQEFRMSSRKVVHDAENSSLLSGQIAYGDIATTGVPHVKFRTGHVPSISNSRSLKVFFYKIWSKLNKFTYERKK